MDEKIFDGKIRNFFAEDSHCAAIQRKYMLLELLITADHLLNHNEAQLVSQKGRTINVHSYTIKHYWELQSLIYDYTKLYGKNPDLEAMKEKWATPARKAYFNSN